MGIGSLPTGVRRTTPRTYLDTQTHHGHIVTYLCFPSLSRCLLALVASFPQVRRPYLSSTLMLKYPSTTELMTHGHFQASVRGQLMTHGHFQAPARGQLKTHGRRCWA